MTNGTPALPPVSSTDTLVGGAAPPETAMRPSAESTLFLGSAPGLAIAEPPAPRGSTVVLAAPRLERSSTAPPASPANEATPPSAETVKIPKPSLPPPVLVPARPAARISTRTAIAFGAGLFALGLVAIFALKHAVARTERWLTPMRLSAADPRVLQTKATLEETRARRAELVMAKKELDARLAEANRAVEIESAFQKSYEAAIAMDLRSQRAELKRLSALLEREEASEDATRRDEIASRVELTRRRASLLERFAKSDRGTYGELALRREYDRSRSAGAQAFERAVTFATSRLELDARITKTDELLETLAQSAYAKEGDGDVVLGFVPYGNVAQLREGAPLVACAATFLRCRAVGTVGKLLAPEVEGTHAFDGAPMRGRLVRLTLTEPGAAELPYLYAGKPPFRS